MATKPYVPIQVFRLQRQISAASQNLDPRLIEHAKSLLAQGENRYAVMRHLRDDGPLAPGLAIATVLAAEKAM